MAKLIKGTGAFHDKSNKLEHCTRAAQLASRGVPRAVIGMIARAHDAAPGQRNYRGTRGK